jgi:hypothetical protein
VFLAMSLVSRVKTALIGFPPSVGVAARLVGRRLPCSIRVLF